MLKIKEEFDYKSLSRRLEMQLDKLIAENERQKKAFDDEVEKINLEAQNHIVEVERNFADALEVRYFILQISHKGSLSWLHFRWLLIISLHMLSINEVWEWWRLCLNGGEHD